MKKCSKCKEIKYESSFHSKGRNKELHSQCKDCIRTVKREHYHKFPDKQVDKNRRIKIRHKENGKWTSPIYVMSGQEYDKMAIAQDNRCAICKQLWHKRLDVDHCHTTGKIRGLLCGNCNRGLGLFRENRAFLFSAIEYLDN